MFKMASTLSEEEFHRMQLQLIELRTAKYELEMQSKKQEREILTLRESYDTADRELQKALKAINKSKKAKEMELLIQENDSLQMKLSSQEDEFRLQNQTLMQELTLLVSKNEELEKQMDGEKESSAPGGELKELKDEIRSLQAENSVLKKKITAVHGNNEDDNAQDEVDSKTEDKVIENQNQGADTKENNSENSAKTIEDVQLRIDTISEENRILRLEKTKVEENYNKEVKTLKEELEKVSEKFRRKQESYLQLQDEKESSFKESSTKFQELQASKERDQKYYTDQINKQQQEMSKLKKQLEENHSKAEQTVKNLQNKMEQMQQQLNASGIVESQHIQEKTVKFEAEVKELRTQILKLTQQRDDLTAQLQESQKAGTDALEQLCSLQKDRDLQIQAVQENRQIAEKRKSMLDELAIKYQKDCDKHREQLLSMENDYENKLKELTDKVKEESGKSVEMDKLKGLIEEQNKKMAALEESKGWLERKLAETEGTLAQTKEEHEATVVLMKTAHEEELKRLKSTHTEEIDSQKNTFQAQIDELKSSEESHNETIQSQTKEIDRLKQEIKDGENDKKVHEKKGKSVLKDLKKQLHAERKRAEKLQERLQEVLSNGSHNKSIEDLLRNSDLNESWREDQSSISSWSGGGTLASSYTANHSSYSTSPHSSPQSPLSGPPPLPRGDETLEKDNKELMDRLASVQQQKWDLEEKVRHLETSNAGMAEDIIDKSRIIEHYVMESRTDTKSHPSPVEDKNTLKKVLDMVKNEDQGLRDMNKKLQNMLEESLTKNMHLQKDLETISQEVVRLSKNQVDTSTSSTSGAQQANGT